MNAHYYIALIIGLSSSLHCVGMCGPIVAAIPLNRKNNFTIAFGLLQYNFGRIFTYSVLGFLIGNIGLTINMFSLLQVMSVILGILMLLFAWRNYINAKLKLNVFPRFQQKLARLLGQSFKSKSPFKYIVLGLLNGLLPCGMVFIALSNALLTGNPAQSAVSMFIFGLGTVPMMVAVGFLVNNIRQEVRRKMQRAVPILISIVAVLIILRGLNLDIPLISPKMTEVKEANGAPGKIDMKCCPVNKECD